jgi:hypothetical protein
MPCRSLGRWHHAPPPGAGACAPRSTSARKVRGQRSLGDGRVCSVLMAFGASPIHKEFSLWIFPVVDFRLFPCYTLDCNLFRL